MPFDDPEHGPTPAQAREVDQRLSQLESALRGATGAGLPADETARFEAHPAAKQLSPAAQQAARRSLELSARLDPAAPAADRERRWREWTLELPWPGSWSPANADAEDLPRVAESLDAELCGHEEVKTRVLEFLAVRALAGSVHGSAVLFLGPPGTGKTSMAHALARALERPLCVLPLGGITREDELVGRSCRYANARPGRVLESIVRAGSVAPVVLLDELDELSLGGSGSGGGPLLDLLDPERNHSFFDQYLGVPFDLSRALFVATAGDEEDLPEALLERMEVIEFHGYTEREKRDITRRHLLPRARAHAGLNPRQLKLTPAALRTLLRNYTEEAGVRHLRVLIDGLARKAALRVVRGEDGLTVTKASVFDVLGPASTEEDLSLRRPRQGIATGLAWTSAGGSLLPIEAIALPGAGRLVLTGQVGEVLRESVQTALSFLRTCFPRLGIDEDWIDEHDLHMHFPAAATPKDGPSAGLPIATALLSLICGVPARHDVALTGEVSLHGQVLAVGGIREKLLAALRAGLQHVIVPARNADELRRLPLEVHEGLELHLVEDVREAFELALVRRAGVKRALPTLAALRSRGAARRARARRHDKNSGSN